MLKSNLDSSHRLKSVLNDKDSIHEKGYSLENTSNLKDISGDDKKDVLEKFMKGFEKVTIDQPFQIFTEKILKDKETSVEYGILELLQGDWYSYIEDNSERISNIEHNKYKDNIGSGIHTTIMPSPGTTQNNIPGKFSFECDEYVEKLSFDLVPGGIRNRGGANEQFCGAVKYEQSIKSINTIEGEKKFIGIHEENGMYLWLADLYKHPATQDSIKKDRGVHNWNNEEGIKELIERLYPSEPGDEELNNFKSIVKNHPFLDVTLYNINTLEKPQYVTELPDNQSVIVSVVPAKELQVGEGMDRPTFVPDYSISRSGVVPHGSTITLLGDLKRESGSFLINGEPMFVNPAKGTWDYDHLAVSPTMGGATSPSDKSRPFDLYNPPILPFTPVEDLNIENDNGENLVYSQTMFLHNLYPYSVRPDLRLRDALKNQVIKNHIKVEMFSQKEEGAQGGIVNIPFVNRFVPTVNMKMNMWLETVIEEDKEILQLQYEQIIFFEFGFGDGGGTTNWPHIQVNTLRQYKDLNDYSRKLVDSQFICPQRNAFFEKIISNPEIVSAKCPVSTSKESDFIEQISIVKEELISKCPFHNSKK
ncbi:MAG: hypothetical protein J0G96_10970 [Flavobacteriia bacterium]|nr:hypothetical protein [Flavobacteriia bacterium]